MNKLTKLMLASAVMVTSGFAFPEEPTEPSTDGVIWNGEIVAEGTIVQNENVTVDGLISVASGGALENNAVLTIGANGGIVVATALDPSLTDLEKAAADNKIEVCPVDGYKAGNLVGTFERNEGEQVSVIDGFYINAGSITNTSIVKGNVVPSAVTCSVSSEEVTTILWNTPGVNYMESYAENEYYYYLEENETFEGFVNTNEDHWGYDDKGKRVYAKVGLKFEDLDDVWVHAVFKVKVISESSVSRTINWTQKTTQTQTQYESDLIQALYDAGVTVSGTAGGTFTNKKTIDLTNASKGTFSGTITQNAETGEIQLKSTTAKVLGGLIISGGKVSYTYDSVTSYAVPALVGDEIKGKCTPGMDAASAEADCKGKFNAGSNFTFNGIANETTGSDGRYTFEGLLGSVLNATSNKLNIEDIDEVVNDYNDSKFKAPSAIKLQIVGESGLTFVVEEPEGEGSDKKVTFVGSQAGFKGVASFDTDITKVHANGANTLPQKLASTMSQIALEIDGENTINNGGSTAIKSLTVNSGAKLKVAAGTTLTVGSASA